MTHWAIIFLAVAGMAAPFGYADWASPSAATAAQILFGVFASLFAATILVKWLRDRM